jgi:hypothetical protein
MPTTRKSSKPGGKFKKPPPPTDSPVKTVRAISLQLHIGQNTISRAIYAGKFPATATDTSWRVDTSHPDFKKWVEGIKEWSAGPGESNQKRREILARARAVRIQRKKELEEKEGQQEDGRQD